MHQRLLANGKWIKIERIPTRKMIRSKVCHGMCSSAKEYTLYNVGVVWCTLLVNRSVPRLTDCSFKGSFLFSGRKEGTGEGGEWRQRSHIFCLMWNPSKGYYRHRRVPLEMKISVFGVFWDNLKRYGNFFNSNNIYGKYLRGYVSLSFPGIVVIVYGFGIRLK